MSTRKNKLSSNSFLLGLTASFFFSGLLFNSSVFGQWSLQTLSSARYGRLPNLSGDQNPSVYSDASFEYRYRWFNAGLRLEGFGSQSMNAEYNQITQRYAEVNYPWATVRAGNVYGIFGKGIILRGFELPGFIHDGRFPAVRQRVIRDFDGVKVDLSPGPVRVIFIKGSPGDPLSPPNSQERRNGDLTGGQFNLSLPAAVSVGAGYVEHKTTFTSDRLSTYFLNWSADELLEKLNAPWLTFDLYAEYANTKDFGKPGGLDLETPHALYLAGNFTVNNFGGSLEYKDYQKFDFGINDPPPLIRENSEHLLNRATHVLNSASERGTQVELFYSPTASTQVVMNYSRARNHFSFTQPEFEEKYLAVNYTGEPYSLRFFVDSGKDEEFSENSRFTAGVAPEYTLKSGSTLGLDVQWQSIEREVLDIKLTNFYAAFRVQNWNNLSFAASVERSTDPDVTDTATYFLNFSTGWRPLPQIDLLLFAGKRRRGTACDHGYCIEVQEFEGAELRFETRW